MNPRLGIVIVIGSLVFLSLPGWAMALTTPTFPDCNTPQGTMKVHYDSGTHGIVGDITTYQGKDTVYQLNDDALTQCFCSDSNQGIQTNWWKASSLSDEDRAILQKEGWTLVPDGSQWGLDPVVYLAKNISFSCTNDPGDKGGGGGTGSPGTTSSGTSGGTGNGGVSGAASGTGDVLGLAATGNISQIMLLSAIGSLLITLGLMLKKRKS